MPERASLNDQLMSPGSGRGATCRELEVCLRFGVAPASPARVVAWPEQVEVAAGRIVLVVGPSGSGKSSMLTRFVASYPTARCVHRVEFPRDVSVLDAVAPGEPLIEAVRLLTACSLGEPALWLRLFDTLSEGEQFRARLARAISLGRRMPGGPLVCDEFGSSLHRRLARAIAFNLRRLASRDGLALIVATAHEDLVPDLRPDVVIRLSWCGGVKVEFVGSEQNSSEAVAAGTDRGPTVRRRLRIERGSMREYAGLAKLHYRQGNRIGCVDKVFVLRDDLGGETLGAVVYGHSPLELSLRNEATADRFVRDASRLNREMRILRRLVVHPDVRGCGIARWLVAQTLPMVGTRYVECLSAMGLVNPVFERAGMRRIGLCPEPRRQQRLLRELREMGADPLAAGFVSVVCRRPQVRRLVAGAVFDWYRSATRGARQRVARQGPGALAQMFRQLIGSRPVYYLWERKADSSDGSESANGASGGGPDGDRS